LNLISHLSEIFWLDQQHETLEDLLETGRREGSNLFVKVDLIDGDDLRYIHNTRFWKVRLPPGKADIARGFSSLEVGGEGTNDDGADPTSIKEVILNHKMGMTITGCGTGGDSEIDPKNIPLADHQAPAPATLAP
jgi:hypothetical protein